MGTLTLPSTGPIDLDASGFIDSVERIEPYYPGGTMKHASVAGPPEKIDASTHWYASSGDSRSLFLS